MILLDTNILIAVIRAADPSHLVDQIRDNNGAICGIVRAELLHGTRSDSDRLAALAMLNALTQIPIRDSMWDQVGDNLRALRARGLTVPFSDAVLATLAIESGMELWTRDNHFVLMQSVLPALRLFAETP